MASRSRKTRPYWSELMMMYSFTLTVCDQPQQAHGSWYSVVWTCPQSGQMLSMLVFASPQMYQPGQMLSSSSFVVSAAWKIKPRPRLLSSKCQRSNSISAALASGSGPAGMTGTPPRCFAPAEVFGLSSEPNFSGRSNDTYQYRSSSSPCFCARSMIFH